MKTIKIGRSTINDVVLNDPTVSAQHAIVIIADDGQKTLKDLNSTNGTCVNGLKVHGEISLKVSDTIKFGNTTVDMGKILNPPSKTKISNRENEISIGKHLFSKTIGRSSDNDIIFSASDVSSHHALLSKQANGEVVLSDNSSSNGTFVNGNSITVQKLHAGDIVLISNKYPLKWESVFPTSMPRTPAKWRFYAMGAFLTAALVIAYLWAPWKPWQPGKKGTPENIYTYYNKSVVLIYQSYYFQVTTDGETIGNFIFDEDNILELEKAGYPMGAFGTGFFVSADGLILTNRHVMNPNMTEQEHISQLKRYFQSLFEQYALALQYSKPALAVGYRNAANNIEVQIVVNQTAVAPNDTYVTTLDDFMPCTVKGDTGSEEVDLGLIQLNSKRLPEGVCYVDLTSIDPDITEGKQIFTIGFPRALIIGTTSQGIEAQKQSGHISQIRGNIEFGHNLNIDHGSSGSPIFSERGRLIGVVNAGFLGASGNFNMGIQSKHAVELVNKY